MKPKKTLFLRSITYTLDLDKVSELEYLNVVKNNLDKIKLSLEKDGTLIRTIRFNIIPIKQKERLDLFFFLKKVKLLAEFSNSVNVRWFNISFDLTHLEPKDVVVINSIGYEIIKKFSNAFINFIISDAQKVNTFASKICAQTVLNISKLSHNGFDNFRVGVSLNPTNNTPFFPFSFGHNDHAFSIAIELTAIVLDYLRIESVKTLEEKRQDLLEILSPVVSKVDTISKSIETSQQIRFGGMDMSFAPFPDDKISVVEILHLLGIDEIGSNGTLFFTAYLTGLLKTLIANNKLRASGFNGVMFSLLEDHTMCKANNKKLLSIDRIIGYSTLCGCGLDMVPIPGHILVEELASIILDVAAIAIRLEKPLGVRVLPIPNKEVNELTEFDMDFLTNTRVMATKNLSLNSNIFH